MIEWVHVAIALERLLGNLLVVVLRRDYQHRVPHIVLRIHLKRLGI